jgi:cobalt-zinc-cadmium resistance protein CzcA
LIISGVFQLNKLPIDAVPDITNNQVQIITSSPSLGATDVERLITFPIEQNISNIAGVYEVRSFSRFGLSLVTVVFDDDVDVYWARQQVSEKLVQAMSNIPAGIGTPSLAPVTTGLGEIYQYVLRVDNAHKNKYSLSELRTIQDWLVRRQLLGVKGVADVSSFGGHLKQYEVRINAAQLSSKGLSLIDVFQSLEKNNQNSGGAYIEKNNSVQVITVEGLLKSKTDIQNTLIKNNDGLNVRIGDIATVSEGHAKRYGAVAYNDEGETVGAVVMMLKGENSREVIGNIKERIERIKNTLPEGVTVEPFLDRTKMVNNAIHTVVKNLSEGALIVVFVLVLFLGNFRAGFLVASVIPLAMLFAIICMNIFGVGGNLMSLGALDFGLIVDGAVIIVESVLHVLMSKRNAMRRDTNAVVSVSAGKMMNSAVFGQIIILIVYLPILSLEGIEGKMFKPMAQTVAFALVGAFLLSLTYIPMMSSWLFSKDDIQELGFTKKLFAKVQNVYSKILNWSFNHQKIIFGSTAFLLILGVFLGSRLGGEFIPTLEEGDFAVESRIVTGSNINTTLQFTQKAAGIIKKQFPEVEKVVTKIGSGEIPTDPMPMEAADMMVILKPKENWVSATSFDELAIKMQASIDSIQGLETGFQFPVQMRFNELMTGAKQDVICKIFGEDLDTLTHYAAQLGAIADGIKGAEDIYVETMLGMPQLKITLNREKMALLGVTIEDANKIINSGLGGEPAGNVFEGEKRFSVVVKLDDQSVNSSDKLESLMIPTQSGSFVPLSSVADIKLINGVNQIQREDAKRRILVGFNLGEEDVQTVVNQLQKQVDSKLKLPAGYYITYGGSFENLKQANARLSIAVPISLALILILLYFSFKSLKIGLLVFTAIPLSAVGGIIILVLRDMPFSISAGVGFIALFGVSVLNGIVLISEFLHSKSENSSFKEIIFNGSLERLRPVLITAAVASLGFLPMALSTGSGAEVQKPLASVVIGGLIFSTALTLIVLPIMYHHFFKKQHEQNQ